jgi:hypothetical protein
MPEATPSHSKEGWEVHAGGALGLAASIYILAFLGIGAAAITFALYFPPKPDRPIPAVYPAPQLNGRLDSDPTWSYAPKQSGPAGIDQAMQALAAKGDAGWAATGKAGSQPGGGGR